MQKWEYCSKEIIIRRKAFATIEGETSKADNRSSIFTQKELDAILKDFGLDGWEAYCVEYLTSDRYMFFFKRPVEN